jgi:hypothetical protein
MNKNSVVIVMLIVIASPFIFHLQDSPEKVAIAAVMGTLSLSCLAAGGFSKWLQRMKTPRFAMFWAVIWILVAAAPFVALHWIH